MTSKTTSHYYYRFLLLVTLLILAVTTSTIISKPTPLSSYQNINRFKYRIPNGYHHHHRRSRRRQSSPRLLKWLERDDVSSSSSSFSLLVANIVNLDRGGYTDEETIQEKLSDEKRLAQDVETRLLHWKKAYNISTQKILHDPNNNNYNNTITSPSIATDEHQLINKLINSLEWYRKNGTSHKLTVPISRRRHWLRRYNNHPTTDTNENNNKFITLNCRSFTQANANAPVVIVVTGWGESHVTYCDFLKELYDAGCTVHTYDHRCQGFSSPSCNQNDSLSDVVRRRHYDSQITHIWDINDYVKDLIDFCQSTSQRHPPGTKMSLVAHSMGCLVGIMANDVKQGSLFHKMALICPSFQAQTPLPPFLLLPLLTLLTTFPPIATRPAIPSATIIKRQSRGAGLPRHGITHCHIRRSFWEMLRFCFPCELIVLSPSLRWVREILVGGRQARRVMMRGDGFRKEEEDNVLVLTAGQDGFVRSDVTKTVVEKMISEGRRVGWRHYDEAFHGLLNEDANVARDDVMRSLLSFLRGDEGNDMKA